MAEFKSDAGTNKSIGEVVVKYADGSLLLLTPDGRLWALKAEEILSLEPTDEMMSPMTSDEIYEQFQAQLPPGFLVHKTKHYVLVYNTSAAYVKWVGELFERLYRGFYNYWKSQRVRLEEPRFPLVAIVFSNKASYLQYAEREIGDSAKAMIGYYNLNTNRMISYDLTGMDGLLPRGTTGVPTSRLIDQVLSQPQAERTVATIVHEAVHQIAYNSGLQVRLADNPRWVSEGLAMFFESPDFSSSTGWSMGKVNYYNLRKFAQYLPQRRESVAALIADDSRLVQSATAQFAYPESWALTYFLMKTKKKAYADYLQELATLEPLGETTPRERVDMFKKHFGEDLQQLDQQFIQYMRIVR